MNKPLLFLGNFFVLLSFGLLLMGLCWILSKLPTPFNGIAIFLLIVAGYGGAMATWLGEVSLWNKLKGRE